MAGLELIPAELVERFAEHHIDTVGALLGATGGLLDTIRVGEEYEALAVKTGRKSRRGGPECNSNPPGISGQSVWNPQDVVLPGRKRITFFRT